jgi:hypothetical protein
MEYIGLASNIISFIEVGTKVAKCYYDIRNSNSGATETNNHVERITHELEDAAKSLSDGDSTGNDEELRALAKECEKLSKHLLGIIHGLQPSRAGRIHAFLKSIEAYRREDDIIRMDGLLSSYRQQLALRLQFLML